MSWWNYPTDAGPSQALSGMDPGGGQRLLLALPIFLFLAPFFLNASGVRFTPPVSAFSVSAFCLLLGFSPAYFRPRMFATSIHPLGFLLSAFCFQLFSPACAGSAAGGR
jgi:hypothetical protein